MALVCKFAAMVSPNRETEKKFIDAGDFIDIVDAQPATIDLHELRQLADKVYPGGGAKIHPTGRRHRGRPHDSTYDESCITEYIMVTHATANGQQVGQIVQVIGSTFDAEFEEGHLPEIYNALQDRHRLQGRHAST